MGAHRECAKCHDGQFARTLRVAPSEMAFPASQSGLAGSAPPGTPAAGLPRDDVQKAALTSAVGDASAGRAGFRDRRRGDGREVACSSSLPASSTSAGRRKPEQALEWLSAGRVVRRHPLRRDDAAHQRGGAAQPGRAASRPIRRRGSCSSPAGCCCRTSACSSTACPTPVSRSRSTSTGSVSSFGDGCGPLGTRRAVRYERAPSMRGFHTPAVRPLRSPTRSAPFRACRATAERSSRARRRRPS